jgi:UDPglucose--hexose-1-phosphate uridylyltransferase
VASLEFLRGASHRRLNPLTGEWVLVSPHRAQRPWQGQREPNATLGALAHDPDCYLCPGNLRANGARNPDYSRTFVFDNDFPALQADAPTNAERDGLLVAEGEPGRCRVLCFSRRHDLTLSGMAVPDIERVVDVWVEETKVLGGSPDIASVQIFENRGDMMGASNPHPHGQIWATRHLPNELEKETLRQGDYLLQQGRPLLLDYLAQELQHGERVVLANHDFCVLVPFWANWPFETLILPRRRIGGFDEMRAGEKTSLAQALSQLTKLYDRLFDAPFPYSMGFHQKPTDAERDGLLVAEGESGRCRVLCFSPRHDLTLSGMTVADIERVVDVWVEETIALGGLPDIASVQIFENRGEMMGASNPHPHGQIWATRHSPNELR